MYYILIILFNLFTNFSKLGIYMYVNICLIFFFSFFLLDWGRVLQTGHLRLWHKQIKGLGHNNKYWRIQCWYSCISAHRPNSWRKTYNSCGRIFLCRDHWRSICKSASLERKKLQRGESSHRTWLLSHLSQHSSSKPEDHRWLLSACKTEACIYRTFTRIRIAITTCCLVKIKRAKGNHFMKQ